MGSELLNKQWKNYIIIEEIGRGGMGVVYKAQQLSPQRVVAIKFSQANSSAKSNRRFLREMKVSAQLQHPGIPKVFDAGIENNHKYIVMEYISGHPLNVYLRKNALSQQQKIDIFLQLCATLDYAHRQGIVHRDIKPANIIIDHSGKPYVIDFGLAKQIDNEQFDLTKSGEIIGTPNYMAPEQISGKRSRIDHQVDIYALGAMLYEMLCGKLMIEGSNIFEVACRIQDGNYLALLEVNPELDKNLQVICNNATHHNKRYRYTTVKSLMNDVETFLCGGKVKNNYSLPTFLLLASSVGLLLMGVWFLFSHNRPQTIELSEKDKKRRQHFQKIVKALRNEAPLPGQDIQKLTPQQRFEVAKVLYQEQRYKESKKILTTLKKSEETTYYHGLIFYQRRQYKQAQASFQKLVTAKPQNAKYNYYLGICYLQQQFVPRALQCFLIAIKDFQDDISLLELIAKIYQQNNDVDKAEKYWKRCVELSPSVSKYMVALAKISLQKKKYYHAFTYLKKSFLLGYNPQAMELMQKIPYYEPRLRKMCFHTLMHESIIEREAKRPDFYTNLWIRLRKRYQQSYISWQEGTKNANASIKNFLIPIKNKELRYTVTKALSSLRYSKTFDKEMQKAFDSKKLSPQSVQFFLQIQKKLRNLRRRELRGHILYQLTYMQIHNSWHKLPRISTKQFLQMLRSKSNVFAQYLLVKGCLHSCGFRPLVQIATNNKENPILRILCCAILRENYLAAKIDIFSTLPNIQIKSDRQREFLQVVVAQNMYVRHEAKRKDTYYRYEDEKGTQLPLAEKKLLLFLLRQKSSRVALSAATSLHGLLGKSILRENPKVRDIIVSAIQSQDIHQCAFANYMFWGSLHLQKNEEYLPLYRKALLHPNNSIREIVLSYPRTFRYQIPNLLNEIDDCLQSSSDKVRLSALFMWTLSPNRKTVIFNHPVYKKNYASFTDVEHSFSVILFFTKLFGGIQKVKNPQAIMHALSFFKQLKQQLHTFPPLSQCTISYTLSMLGIHPTIAEISNKKDPYLLSYFIYQLHQELNISQEFQIPFIQKQSSGERKYMAQKFIHHKDNRIRMSALSTYIAFTSEKERHKWYNKAFSSQDIHLRKGVAQGFYLAVITFWTQNNKNHKFGQDLAEQSIDSLLYQNISRLENFIQHKKQKFPKKYEKIKKWITKAHTLDPKNDLYIFILALCESPDQKIEKITQAIQLDKQYRAGHLQDLYTLKLLDTLIAQGDDKTIYNHLQQIKITSPFLTTHIGKIFYTLKQYPQALEMYEKNFLIRSTEYSPFKEVFTQHLQIVRAYIQLNDLFMAKTMLEYMYQLYRRERWRYENISREEFLELVKGSHPDIMEQLK
ncbi:serine/threonine-protein kinase [Candidatus Uabimicrobium amorphum]|uniref:Protein kinase n=1 Tax=Uabimicrobium amorphum TaxID=2596890 RepID=A0A5S9INY5_UABAM|nr:serine/threonine-protein kinase [Candidatus Uabimicrobium amorphum]BBM85041.1 protein kinase [Candidatus Uabimicrobium amorphum]